MVLASVITLVALPTIWLANRSEDGSPSRPNVAAVGLDPGQADDAPAEVDAVLDPMGASGAAYLEELSSVVPVTAAVVVGTAPDQPIATAQASFRRSSVQFDTCEFNGASQWSGGHDRQRGQRAHDDLHAGPRRRTRSTVNCC